MQAPQNIGQPKKRDSGQWHAMILESVITCPHCGTAKMETMPTDACQFFYACTGCGARLRPKPRDCCVFCSYGSVPCPPIPAKASRALTTFWFAPGPSHT